MADPIIENIMKQIRSLPASSQRTLMRRSREIIHKDGDACAELSARMIMGNHIKFEDVMDGAHDYK